MKSFLLSMVLTVAFLIQSMALAQPGITSPPSGPPSYMANMPFGASDSACIDVREARARRQNPDPADVAECNRMRALQYNNALKDSLIGACKTENSEYTKAANEFGKSCGEIGGTLKKFEKVLKPEVNRDSFMCAYSLERCMHCASGGTSQFIGVSLSCNDLGDDPEPSKIPDYSALLMGGQGATQSTVRSQMSEEDKKDILNCAPRAGEGLTAARDRAREARRDFRELEGKQVEAQTKLADANNKRTENTNRLQDEAEGIQNDAKKVVNDLRDRQENQEARIAELISKAEADHDTLALEIMRIMRSRDQAEIAFVEAQAALDRQCHAQALARIETVRREMIEQVKRSEFSTGDLNSLLAGSGNSQKNKFKLMARDFYNDCRKDDNHRSAVQSAGRARSLAIQTANEEAAGLQKKQSQVSLALQQLKTTERTKALEKTARDLETVRTQMVSRLATLDKKSQALGAQAATDLTANYTKLNQLNAQVARERFDYEADQELYDLKRKHSGGKSYKDGAFDSARTAYGNVKERAARVVASCCPSPTGKDPKSNPSTSIEGVAEAMSYCRAACTGPLRGIADGFGNCPEDTKTHRSLSSGQAQ